MKRFKRKTGKLLLTLLATLLGCSGHASPGITYQGRILKPDGSALDGAVTQFKIQIRSGDSAQCLMYEEVQTINLQNTNGFFALTINDGHGTRTDASGIPLVDVFSNSRNFTINPLHCASGSGNYTPAADDTRILLVLFKDESMSTWEPIAPQRINFVPFAFEAWRISGFPADALFRVRDSNGDPQNISPLSNDQYLRLIALADGTSTQYAKNNELGGAALPSINSLINGQVLSWNGTAWAAFSPVGGDNSVTSSMLASGAVGTAAISNSVSISTSGTLSAAVASARELRIYAPDPGTGFVSMRAPVSLLASGNYSLTWPLDAGSANQFLKTDGSGNLSWAAVPGSGGTVVQVTSSNSDISISNSTTNPVLTLNSGSSANQIVKLDNSGKLPPVDGSQLLNLSAGSLGSGVLPVSRGGTGATSFANYSVVATTSSGSVVGVPGTTSRTMLLWDITGPLWSTSTWPASTSANQLLYSSTANNVSGLSTANNSVLSTSATGVPQFSSSLPSAVQTNITSLGTVTSGVWNGSALDAAHGGTGLTAFTPGDLIFASSANALSKLSAGASGYLLTYNGPGSVPSWQAAPIASQWTAYGPNIAYTDGGKVGIATSNPTYQLDVAGTGRFSGLLDIGGTSPGLTLYNGSTSVGTVGGASGSQAYSNLSVTNDMILRASAGNLILTTKNASGNIVFATGASDTEKLRLTQTGNLGIGITAPTSKLHVAGSGTFTGNVYLDATTASTWPGDGALTVAGGVGIQGKLNVGSGGVFDSVLTQQAGASVYPSNTLAAFTNSGAAQILFHRSRGTSFSSPSPVSNGDSIGRVTGGAFNGTAVEDAATISLLVDGTDVTGSGNHPGGRIDFNVRGPTYAGSLGTGLTAMTVRNNGFIGIGTTNPTAKLDVQGGNINTSGSVIAGGVTLTSDKRFKKNIHPLSGALSKIMRLRGVSYDWRKDEYPDRYFSSNRQLGVIAQEVEDVFPELVDRDPNTGFLTVNYSGFVSPLIESTKELGRVCKLNHDEHEALKLKIYELESMNEALRAKLLLQETRLRLIEKHLGM